MRKSDDDTTFSCGPIHGHSEIVDAILKPVLTARIDTKYFENDQSCDSSSRLEEQLSTEPEDGSVAAWSSGAGQILDLSKSATANTHASRQHRDTKSESLQAP